MSSDMRCNRRHQSCVFVNERRSAEWIEGRSMLNTDILKTPNLNGREIARESYHLRSIQVCVREIGSN